MLNIWIVLRRIRNNVMDIVVIFPPANGQAADKVCNGNSNQCIDEKVVGDTHVACIMYGEYKLMPKKP
jgi:hypothetical protein